jgi:hypothetical protein
MQGKEEMFIQSFFLAPQEPRGYYVLNDVIRTYPMGTAAGPTENGYVTAPEARPVQQASAPAPAPAPVQTAAAAEVRSSDEVGAGICMEYYARHASVPGMPGMLN